MCFSTCTARVCVCVCCGWRDEGLLQQQKGGLTMRVEVFLGCCLSVYEARRCFWSFVSVQNIAFHLPANLCVCNVRQTEGD